MIMRFLQFLVTILFQKNILLLKATSKLIHNTIFEYNHYFDPKTYYISFLKTYESSTRWRNSERRPSFNKAFKFVSQEPQLLELPEPLSASFMGFALDLAPKNSPLFCRASKPPLLQASGASQTRMWRSRITPQLSVDGSLGPLQLFRSLQDTPVRGESFSQFTYRTMTCRMEAAKVKSVYCA